ncbi:Integrase, catalytic core [Gossypium australe]|uniref:Integrase, catalytic core n=1 Tax=Gossypium australe TaxID=47621 RepID=A0A5B6WRT1_9ROSI|nr:Integrase, catalytic core [Gossypium australe]
MPIRVSKLEVGMHSVEVNMCQMQVVIKELVIPSSGEVEEMDTSTRTLSARDGVVESVKKEEELRGLSPKEKQSKPPIPTVVPFLAKLEERKKKESEEFWSFLNMFKDLNVNLPLLELPEKMPNIVIYTKVLLKLKDPDSFTIPTEIGGVNFGKALCDLGAHINFTHYPSLVGDLQETLVTLQLVDFLLVHPKRVLEMSKLELDFIVLDFLENVEILILLGLSFLSTFSAKIDVGKGELTMEIEEEIEVYRYVDTYPSPKDMPPSPVYDC